MGEYAGAITSPDIQILYITLNKEFVAAIQISICLLSHYLARRKKSIPWINSYIAVVDEIPRAV